MLFCGAASGIGTTLLYAEWKAPTWLFIAPDAVFSDVLAESAAVASGAAPDTAWFAASPCHAAVIFEFRPVPCSLMVLCRVACSSVTAPLVEKPPEPRPPLIRW